MEFTGLASRCRFDITTNGVPTGGESTLDLRAANAGSLESLFTLRAATT
jgi:hypothetical protein